MQVHNLTQGSSEWHAYRREHFNASDAPAMLSCSPYKTRGQLIAELATGITPDVDAATQRVFDAGHRFESLARPLAERIIGEELAPLVGSNGKYSASFDGVTLMGDTGWEHKSLNAELRAAMVDGCTGADLPKVYRVQMEQQCMVEEALTRVLFTASKWDGDELVAARHCWYTPDPVLRAEIVSGWAQLEKDVAAYVAPDAAPVKVVAEAVTALPTVFAQVSGSIALKDNLPEYEVALRDFIDNRLISKPETDQDFANLDLQIKALKGAEAALDASEEQALSQAEMLSAFKRHKDMLHKLTRDTRLMAEKLLTAEKERIKLEQVQRGQKEFAAHIASLNTRLGKPYMPTVPTDFAGAIKGKRTVESLRGAVNDELARAKIESSAIADRIQINLGTLRELAGAHAFLFADTSTIVLKQPEDLTMLVKSRIADHQAAEQQRLEAERERIRAEEQAKAQREAREAEARAEREQQEALRQQVLQAEREAQAGIAEARAAEVLPAPLLDDLSNLAADLKNDVVSGIDADQVISTAQRAAAATVVVPMRPTPAPAERTDKPTLKLGTINERLGGVLTISADGLRSLGFEIVTRERGACLYHEADFPLILAALVRHIESVQAQAAA